MISFCDLNACFEEIITGFFSVAISLHSRLVNWPVTQHSMPQNHNIRGFSTIGFKFILLETISN